jgi:germination protein M
MPNIPVGMRSLAAALSVASALLLVGCMGDEDQAMTTTVRETTSSVPSQAPALVALYFLRDGKVAPEQHGIVSRPAIATATIRQLFEGPESGLTTAIPAETRLRSLKVSGGVASIDLDPGVTDRRALAQIVYTLTQFATVTRVSVNGGPPVGRRAFEQQTPAILVESPRAGEAVAPSFEVTGTANTFEATFNYELKDESGEILSKNFVTATSGSGTRGTFRFTVPYEVSAPQEGRLVVFEISAADGSRTHESSIPLTLR